MLLQKEVRSLAGSWSERKTWGVLDLETRPDPNAVRLAAGGREPITRVGLHRIQAAALLVHGGAGGPELTTWCDEELPEDEMLEQLDAGLTALHSDGGALVTYGGTRHDLVVLQRRAARHWMFGAEGLLAWGERGWCHEDVMTLWSPRSAAVPSLRDLAAGLGLPTSAVVANWRLVSAVQKASADVFATALVHLHHLAVQQRDANVLAEGWLELAEYIQQQHSGATHLRPFSQHEIVRTLRGRRNQLPHSEAIDGSTPDEAEKPSL